MKRWAAVTVATMLALLGPGATPASATTPGQAVATAAAQAAGTGSTEYLSVVDRNSGAVLAQTGNAGVQVGSESIFKLFLASYYLLIYGGYADTPGSVLDQLSFMIRYSDDATANDLFTADAVPTVAARYGLGSTINSTDRTGHWGATRITAHDMTQFLFDAAHDSEIGPWLLPVMAAVNATGSDGFDQHFGMNALSGTHGSKQGWGCDSNFTAQQCAIHSVGYTAGYFVAVLQLSDSGYPDPMRGNATYAASLIQSSSTTAPPPPAPAPPKPAPPAPAPLRPLVDGDYVRDVRTGYTYRLAGGAPVFVYTWAAVGGQQPFRVLSGAQFDSLRARPADGTFVLANGYIYRFAGGAPVYVATWAAFGGPQPWITVDGLAIDHAGQPGPWSHVALRPADGTFLLGGRAVYRMAGGAPIYVSSWAPFGGPQPWVTVDPLAVDHAGLGGVWSHLSVRPADGTFLRGGSATYRVAGGAPLYVPSWAPFGGQQAFTVVDPAAIVNAGGGVYSHLSFRPANGTQLRALQTGNQYVVINGVATPAGVRNPVYIDQTTVTRAGTGGVWNHLAR